MPLLRQSMNIGRKTDQEFCKPTGPWHLVQEACPKSNQGDQEVRRAVDGKPSAKQFSDIEVFACLVKSFFMGTANHQTFANLSLSL